MPIGKFGEVIGTMNTLGDREIIYDSKVVAPKNPKLLRQGAPYIKVCMIQEMIELQCNDLADDSIDIYVPNVAQHEKEIAKHENHGVTRESGIT